MMKMMSKNRLFRCICQINDINSSQIRAHIKIPKNHRITLIKPEKTKKEIKNVQIYLRIIFLKSSNPRIQQTNNQLISNLSKNLLSLIQEFHNHSNSHESLISTSKPNLIIPKNSKNTKFLIQFYNQHLFKETSNYKYLKHRTHQGMNQFLISHITGIEKISIEENLKVLVTGGWDGSIRIFNLESLSQISCFWFHESCVRSIDIKSNFCITGSDDSKIYLINLKTKKLKTCFKGEHGEIYHLMLSGNSEFFLSASFEGYIEIWSISQKQILREIIAFDSVIFARFIQNDQFLICSTYRVYIQKFSFEHQLPVIKEQFKDDIRCSSFIEENNIFLTGHQDGCIQVLKNLKLFKTIQAHLKRVYSIDYCLKSDKFVSGSSDKTVKVWKLSLFSPLNVLDHFKQEILCVKLLNNQIYSSDLGYSIQKSNILSPEVIKTKQREFGCFYFSISIKRMLIVYGIKEVFLHSLCSNSDISSRSFDSFIRHLVFAKVFILCGTENGIIYCVDTPGLEIKNKYIFGVFPIRFVRTTNNWQVMTYSSENKSFLRKLTNSELLITHNKPIKVGKFRENNFVFVDYGNDLYVSNDFRTIRKIGRIYCFQFFWCRSIDYILLKHQYEGFSIINTRTGEENKIESLKGLKYLKRKKDLNLSRQVLILSSLKFRYGHLN